MTDERLIAAKDRAAEEFFTIPGVTAVGLGCRERDGLRTGELVIKVFVSAKKPLGELAPAETLPRQFEGIGVDVEVLSEASLATATPIPKEIPPGSPATAEGDQDDTQYRPLIGGARVQADLSGSGKGTGGSVWRDGNDLTKIYLLTNFHVVTTDRFKPVKDVTRVGNATSSSGPTKCCDDIVGTFAGGTKDDPLRDAALIRLDQGMKYLAEVKCVGVVTGTYDIDPVLDLVLPKPYPVRKYGMRTGLTGGTVVSVHIVMTLAGVRYTNLMLIRPNPNLALKAADPLYFADHGDSGSAILNDDNKIVGLLDAISTQGQVRLGVAFPIKDIVDQFNAVDHIQITPATATTTGDVRTVPGVAPPAAPLELGRALATPLTGYPGALARVGADLESSEAGRQLRALWTDHYAELLDLVDHRRRVTLAWHRGGGPALLHLLVRMAADPALAMPATVNGVPPMDRLAQLHTVFHANASPELRRALDRALTAVPDPATLTYDELLAAIATR